MRRARLPVLLVLSVLLLSACGKDSPSPSSTSTTKPPTGTPSPPGPAPSAAVQVIPGQNLVDGQRVTVQVLGFPGGSKVYLSECGSTRDANAAGCGEQLAAQPFIETDPSGSGRTTFTVSNRAFVNDYDIAVSVLCTVQCSMVATTGIGGHFAEVEISFR